MKKRLWSSTTLELVRPQVLESDFSPGRVRNHLPWKISRAEETNICSTCGTHYPNKKVDGDVCPICLDDRQYIKGDVQQWTSVASIATGHTIKVNALLPNLFELKLSPTFAIDNRALLIVTAQGNILWDCIPFIDENTVEFIRAKGGLNAIAISHPHYYGFMHEWARAFDCPIYLHLADKSWVHQEDRVIFWEEKERQLIPNFKLLHVGGHFPGNAILLWSPIQGSKTIFVGDTIYLSRNQKHLSAMFSFPNVIPLPNHELFEIFRKIDVLDFDQLFGAFEWQNLYSNAKSVFRKSYELYTQLYPSS